jgi:hypothetical protein
MKKIIIIVGIVLIIISIVIFFVISRPAKKQEMQNTETSAANNTSDSTALPQLPNTKSANIDPDNVAQSIKDNISQLETTDQAFVEIQFDENQNQNQSATLHEFEASTGIKIFPDVYGGLRQNEYSIFSCKGETGSTSSLGFTMRFKQGATAAYYANLYSQMDKNLKTWESTIFNDLSPLFFSGKKLSKTPIFKSTKYTTENGAATIDVRFGNAKSDDGSDLSIYYAAYNENVYIFNDSNCLGKALDKYQPALEP